MSKSVTDAEFRALLDLVMCSDPWPVHVRIDQMAEDSRDLRNLPDEENQDLIEELVNRESKDRGFENWIEAFHEFKLGA